MSKVVIWGAGNYCKKVLTNNPIDIRTIVAIIDTDTNKQGNFYQGIEIVSPDKLCELTFDEILVAIVDRSVVKTVFEQVKEYRARHIDDYLKELCEFNSMLRKDYILEHDRLVQMMREIRTINREALKNAKICTSREEILEYMPKGSVCAEVGVAYGDFTKKILSIMKPKKFHAVDLFQAKDFWGRTHISDSGLTHYEWYKSQFENQIENEIMEVHKGYSWEVLENFPNRYFDYIYLDACHSYNAVVRDVEVNKRKIKLGGIIAFNDYTLYNFWTPCTDVSAYYGVVPVANRLINESKSEVIYMGLETVLSNDLVIRYWE